MVNLKEGLYVIRKYGVNSCTKYGMDTYLIVGVYITPTLGGKTALIAHQAMVKYVHWKGIRDLRKHSS